MENFHRKRTKSKTNIIPSWMYKNFGKIREKSPAPAIKIKCSYNVAENTDPEGWFRIAALPTNCQTLPGMYLPMEDRYQENTASGKEMNIPKT